MGKIKKISSFIEYEELVDAYLKEKGLPNTGLSKYEPLNQAFYRGQAISNWAVEPSINRIENFINEKERYDSYISKAKDLSEFQKMSEQQHYDTGTRLLDFTKDPLVALYFACKNHFECDGKVFVTSYQPRCSDWYYTKTVYYVTFLEDNISEISVEDYARFLIKKDKRFLGRDETLDFLCADIMSVLPYGTMIEPSTDDYKKNIRLQVQKGAFFICPPKFVKTTAANTMEACRAIFKRNEVVAPSLLLNDAYSLHIIIPKEIKKNILNILNFKYKISERTLFL